MNKGYIIGKITELGRPAEAFVRLNWIVGGGERLPIYSPDADSNSDRMQAVGRGFRPEMPPQLMNLMTQTDQRGNFCLEFQWSGIELGTAIDNCRCQITVMTEQRAGGSGNIAMRSRGRFENRVVPTVSLSQISSGLLGSPTNPTDLLGMAADLVLIIQEIRRPMVGLTVPAPSPDMYGLFSAFRLFL